MSEPLSRPVASAAVEHAGWRLLLGAYLAYVPVRSLSHGLEVTRLAAEACGADADSHLHADVRPDRVELTLRTDVVGAVTARDADLAHLVTGALSGAGVALAPPSGPRPVQLLEVAIDALDIPAIRPFWKAVLAYVDEPGAGPTGGLIDPVWQGPTFWFQQMDAPRPQRNRIHVDITVSHDEADRRLRAALAAGGVLVSDEEARAFWILADVEGNEICICTWQDRDSAE